MKLKLSNVWLGIVTGIKNDFDFFIGFSLLWTFITLMPFYVYKFYHYLKIEGFFDSTFLLVSFSFLYSIVLWLLSLGAVILIGIAIKGIWVLNEAGQKEKERIFEMLKRENNQ